MPQEVNPKLIFADERKISFHVLQICQRLLKLLGDKNSEVQNLAVKCLGPLVGKVKGNKVENIVDVLGGNMLSENEKLRSISTMGELLFPVFVFLF